MIYILGPRDKKIDCLTINTTTGSKTWSRHLSPMLLSSEPISKNMENLWQFSKVYKEYTDINGDPSNEYYKWRDKGFSDNWAHRYPMGKNKIPEYSFWDNKKFNYIEARENIYIPYYIKSVKNTIAYSKLLEEYKNNDNIALWDYDGYNHDSLKMSLQDVINNPNKKMGHAFVLKMLLIGLYK